MRKQSFYIHVPISGKKMEPFTMFSELKIKSCNSRGDLEAVGNIELNSSSMILCPQHYFFFFAWLYYI